MSIAVSEPEIVGAFPCTQAQERFWFLDRLRPGSVASNIAVQWEVSGAFSNDAVENAFQAIVDRHEILRTRFAECDGVPVQEVVARVDFHLGSIDVRSLPEAERAGRILQIATDLARRPFDLSQPCALRVTLVRHAPARAMLLLAAHHGVFDGFSIRVMGRELGMRLAAATEGGTVEIPDLPIQYGDYAQWLLACREGDAFAAAGAFWREALADLEYFELPADRERQPLGIRRGARVTAALPDDFEARIASAAKGAETSAFGFGAAAFAAALHRFTGLTDISFGTAVAGREEPELEDLVGVFINQVILRLKPAPEVGLAQQIAASQPAIRAALANAAFPFDDLVRDLRLRVDACRTPGVSVYFALQKVFLEEQSYGGIQLKSVPSTMPEIAHDLNLQIIGRASGWHMICDYDADRFDEATVRRLCDTVRRCFDLALAGDTRPLRDLPLGPAVTEEPARLSLVPTQAPITPRPPAETQARIGAIWGRVLGLPPDSCDGDFFDLGGGSLLALRMMARVQEAFGVRPDIADFLRDPTLGGFAADVEALVARKGPEDEAAGAWSLIELREGAADRPLVVSVNQPFLYHALAQRLAPGLAVVNLHLAGPEVLDGGDGPRLEQLATEAAALVARRAAGRPVILMGQCVDGSASMLLAQAMAKAGDGPRLLCMIDTWRPGTRLPGGNGARRLRRMAKRLRRWGLFAAQRLRGEIGWIEFLGKNARARRLLIRLGRLDAPTAVERREWATNALLQDAVRDTDFPPYAGEVLMFSTASQRRAARDILFGWGGVVPDDTPVFDLPGWHEDALLKHGIKRIVAVLDSRAARLGASGPATIHSPLRARA